MSDTRSGPEADELRVQDILIALASGFDKMMVRVRQNGKMRFLPLSEVVDQKLVLKIVLDAIKQAARENGIL